VEFKKIKCIILDIDNTLTNSARDITDYTKRTIKEVVEKGIYVVLCSGRPNHHTIAKSKLSNASPIVISDNGAIIYDYALEKTYYSVSIPKEMIYKLNDICLKNDINCVYDTVEDTYRYNKFPPNAYYSVEIDDLSKILDVVTQVVISHPNIDKIKQVAKVLSLDSGLIINNTNIHVSDYRKLYFCDINDGSVSKGNAIKELMSILGISQEEIICFGDSVNDVSMFEACKYCIAMKNAVDELKDLAYAITEYDNDEDGAARFIKKYILKK
jgi:hypothetical protein